MAWRQLAKEKRRLLAATAGIAFAVILMLVQLGFEQALFQSVSRLYSHMNADLMMISPRFQNAGAAWPFTNKRLNQVVGDPQVDWVCPVYLSDGIWKNPITHRTRGLFLIAFPPRPGVFSLPEVDARIEEIRQVNTVLFDADSRPEFGPIASILSTHGPFKAEFSGVTMRVAGVFHLGTSFQADGNVVASDMTLHSVRPDRNLDLIDMGLIKLKPRSNPVRVRDRLIASVPKDVLILTREGLLEREHDYWASNTPIGFVFRLGLIMGLIVGSVVVYQILYSDVSEHLSEYATLKAMGFRDRFLFWVVIKESLILSVLGFVPGLLLSQLVYSIARSATLLPLQMDPTRVAAVYVLTAAMCILSGALAMRKLKYADPAEIF